MTITNNKDEEINKSITINDLLNDLSEVGNYDDDEDTAKLEEAMEYYCNMSDKREGYKHALILTLREDLYNPSDDYAEDVFKLQEILNK